MKTLNGYLIRLSLFMVLFSGSFTTLSFQESLAQATPEATPAAEAPAPNFAVRPVGGMDLEVFRVEAEAGATISVEVEIENTGNVSLDMRMYAANTQTKINGGYGLEEEDVELRTPATWISLHTESYALEIGEARVFPVEIAVPSEAGAGEYALGFAVRMVDALPIEGSSSFTQIIQKNSAIVVTVPGELTPSFELGTPAVDWSGSDLILQVPVTNTGNAFLSPQGTMSILSPEGVELISGPVEMGRVYTGHNTILAINLSNGLPPGEYVLSLEMHDEVYRSVSASIDNVAITVAESPAELASQPVQLSQVTIEPSGSPMQLVLVSADVTNREEEVEHARVVVTVSRDGEFVEDFIIADNVPLSRGTSTFSQRYVPLDGFQSGTWTFELKVESIGPDGLATLLQAADPVTIEVP